jgi:hypothetical protein
MRRRVVFAGLVGATLAGGFIACGIDENGQSSDGGLDATFDSPVIDSPLDVPIDVPQACKTLDATACIGDASVPDGWTYTVITAGDMLCPTTLDYDKTNFLTGLAPQGGCVCSCAASGTIDCSGTIEAGSQGGNCDGRWTFFDAGNDAACITTSWADPHYAVPTPPTSTAKAQCDASGTPPGWTASTETSCTPKCTADYCNVGNTYKRCIITSQNLLCPAPFTQAQPTFGVEAGVVTSCSGCGCAINSGKCSATIVPFNTTSCDTALADASPANGVCNATGIGGSPGQVNSFMYTPTVPPVSCAPTAITGTSSAQFAGTVTVCCLP